MDGFDKPVRLSLFLLFLIILSISISGCVTLQDPESSQENGGQVVAHLHPGNYAGQTIKPLRNNFNSLQLWLQFPYNEEIEDGEIQFRLFENPWSSETLEIIDIYIDEIKRDKPLTIKFPSRSDSSGQNYFLQIQSNSISFEILGSPEDRYPEGQLFINGTGTDGDIAFLLFYQYGFGSLLDDLSLWFSNIWLIVPMIAVAWLPGSLIIKIINRNNRNPLISHLDLGEKTAISIGISLSVIPIFYLWCSILNIKINQTRIIPIYILALLAYLWFNRFEFRNLFTGKKPKFLIFDKTIIPLVIIFTVSLIIRFVMIRDLSAPPWVDSVHHSLLTRMIIEQEGLPTTYSPYLSISPINYHFGFHTNLAVFHFLSGLDIPIAMLVFGQLLNALTVFAVYLFTTSVIKDKLAGIAAAFITGLVTPMPAYYTSWGRYTQLIGILIFPAALSLILFVIKKLGKNQFPNSLQNFLFRYCETILIAVLACAGLFLSHYRVGIFLGCFFGAYFAVLIFNKIFSRKKSDNLTQQILIFTLIVSLAITMTLPWWLDTFRTFIAPRLSVTSEASQAFQDFHWNYLTAGYGNFSVIAAFMGILLGIFRQKRFALVLPLWILIMFASANLQAIPLPGRGFINNTSVQIFLFIPISAAGGYLISQIIPFFNGLIPVKQKIFNQVILLLAILLVITLSIKNILPILNLQTVLLKKSDLPGIRWIGENVPEDEVILINFFPWAYNLYAGTDGGYWISPIAGRPTMPPTLLYGFDKETNIVWDTNSFLHRVSKYKDMPENLYDILVEENIKYIYAGARGGLFSPEILLQSQKFESIYAYNGTRVIKLISKDSH
jgi:hypothetical protein